MENTGGTFACITEMLLQSNGDAIRLFPCWPKDQNARFGTLRANGAFLVSAELNDGEVSGVAIVSEKGGDCAVVNPWPGKKIKVVHGDRTMETGEGERLLIKTKVGETVALHPL
jgi:hypothetical protein